MRTDRRLPATPSFFLGTWLGAANTAIETWLGFWTAMMPRPQATMVAAFHRQALQAWAAPQALALPAPARHEPPAPARLAAEAAAPQVEAPAVMAPVIEAVADAAETQAAETPEAEPAGPAPARRCKRAAAAAQLRQTPPRKTTAQGIRPSPPHAGGRGAGEFVRNRAALPRTTPPAAADRG